MDEEIERLIVSVRADTQGFAADVATMRGEIDGNLSGSLRRVGDVLDGSLARAIRNGKIGFDDLKSVALGVLAEIANAALRSALGAQGGQEAGLISAATSSLFALLGAPGRATGGPVSPGRAFMVGERGPELFVPTSSGSIATLSAGRSRDVRVSIAINAPAGAAPDMLARSSRQVARAVRGALLRED
jgi:hypothetical protein